eukprot:TRINITY_DN4222_c2_g1_i1.p1 TRINITY_DN4222_c2_g1~~TRINITY_DN4222_c2_g1_i1.p1  ORF type:complete len:307 (+),score=72.30 TRINITY_DN4222_c2_g1_i1:86-1006(+)
MTGPRGLAVRRAAAAQALAGKGPAKQVRLFVYGIHADPSFQKLKAAGEYLAAEKEGVECTVEGFFETQYEQHLRYIAASLGGSFAQAKPSEPLIYADMEDQVLYFANKSLFLEWAAHLYKYEDDASPRDASEAMKEEQQRSGRSYCALNISIDGEPPETVHFELFNDQCPVLAENFLKLLAKPEFNGHAAHRVKPGCWIQAGDLVDGSGLNSEAADGGRLGDESYWMKHDRAGLLGMCGQGKDTIGSQFYVTLRELPFLDSKFCVIGRVVMGMSTIVKLGNLPTKNERPVQEVKIFSVPEFTVAAK